MLAAATVSIKSFSHELWRPRAYRGSVRLRSCFNLPTSEGSEILTLTLCGLRYSNDCFHPYSGDVENNLFYSPRHVAIGEFISSQDSDLVPYGLRMMLKYHTRLPIFFIRFSRCKRAIREWVVTADYGHSETQESYQYAASLLANKRISDGRRTELVGGTARKRIELDNASSPPPVRLSDAPVGDMKLIIRVSENSTIRTIYPLRIPRNLLSGFGAASLHGPSCYRPNTAALELRPRRRPITRLAGPESLEASV
ncbi:hypothetical protein EVAR_18356_1 [Eumeta japonica]|uniref:Uncharacterized protein n=1 Tax=Eumeta variegata TaxID=151549 RepID=A0A4C1V9K3_EUMVA|nr:hypothetical protein EVAR_18356_1 [Eumeta japonica]